MKFDKVSVAIVLVVASITGFVTFQAGQEIASGETAEQTEQYGQWCDEHNGSLVNSRVIGNHGGLHCELQNGTLIHFHDMQINQSDSE